jgi:selenocysteine lyase/cysteine desulfurase
LQVTGVVTDVRRVARILKQNGFLVSLDCAAGGPYMPVYMHEDDIEIDACAFSVHKFLGGPMSSGLSFSHFLPLLP